MIMTQFEREREREDVRGDPPLSPTNLRIQVPSSNSKEILMHTKVLVLLGCGIGIRGKAHSRLERLKN